MLNHEKVALLCEQLQFTNQRKVFLEVLLTLNPRLQAGEWTRLFITRFLFKHLESSRVYQGIYECMCMAIAQRPRTPWISLQSNCANQYPLSESEVVEIALVLRSDDVNKWFTCQTSISSSDLFLHFNKTYDITFCALIHSFRQAAQWAQNEYCKELSFFKDFIQEVFKAGMHRFSEGDIERWHVDLMITKRKFAEKHQITPEENKALIIALEKQEVKSLFISEGVLAVTYSWLLSSLKRENVTSIVQDQFFAKLKEWAQSNRQGEYWKAFLQSDSKRTFLENTFKLVHIDGVAAYSSLVIEDEEAVLCRGLKENDFIQVALMLQQVECTAWLNENCGEFMASALSKSLVHAASQVNLPVFLKVHVFVEKVKARGLDGASCQFFQETLKAIGNCSRSQSDLIEHLENKGNALSRESFAAVNKILNDSEFVDLLKQDDELGRAIALYQAALPNCIHARASAGLWTNFTRWRL